ncbi:MAG: galactose oxidase, partial [Pseudomonadota bacterium]
MMEADENWNLLADLPRPVGEAVTGVLDNRLHITGGRKPSGPSNATWRDHIDAADHFVLSSLGASWERASPLPTARNSA